MVIDFTQQEISKYLILWTKSKNRIVIKKPFSSKNSSHKDLLC